MPNIWASLNVPFIHFLLQFFPNSKSQGHVIFDGNASGIQEEELNRIYGNTENIHLNGAEQSIENAVV
jgi:ABC-type phosphate/phosphonate transport system ATPase subunit